MICPKHNLNFDPVNQVCPGCASDAVDKVMRNQDFKLGANVRHLTLPGGLPKEQKVQK